MPGSQSSDGNSSSYADRSAFTRLLTVPSRVRIIDVFLGKHYTELSAKEIAHLAGIDPATVHRNIEDIVDFGIIELAGKDGSAQTYRLNKSSRIARALASAKDVLMEESDLIPRSERPTFARPESGPVNIQESLEGLFHRHREDSEEGPRASEIIEPEGESSPRRLQARSK